MNNRRFPAKIKVDLNSTTVWLSFPEVCPLTVPFLVSFLDNVTFLLELNALLKRICDFYETSVYYPRACEVCPLYSKLPWGKPKTNNSNRHVIFFFFFIFPLWLTRRHMVHSWPVFFCPPLTSLCHNMDTHPRIATLNEEKKMEEELSYQK